MRQTNTHSITFEFNLGIVLEKVFYIIESPHKGNGCFIAETAEQLSCSSNSFDCGLVKMHDNAGVNSSSPQVTGLKTYKRKNKLVRTYHRKRRKPSHSSENDLKCVGDVGSSVETVKSGRENALSKFSNEAFESAAHVLNKFERGGAAGEGHLQNVVERRSLEKALGRSLDDQHTIGENMNKIVMDNLSKTIHVDISANDISLVDLPVKILEQASETQKNIVVCQVPSVEAKFEEPTRLWKDNDFFGVSGSDPHSEHKNRKQQSEKKITTLISQLGATENGALEAINRRNCPQTLESLERTPSICYGRKLLVLDVNGLLADIVPFDRWKHKPDTVISRKAVFKRPFCDDFLQFCFERFNVGVWSSRTKRNVEYVIDFLMGEARHKLLFCWDQSHCTDTGFYTVENKNKPLLLKELKKLWEKLEPSLPWENGKYNESNTLLLDDTPHKALRNPPNTAIFPKSYAYKNEEDNSLGPGGDLRLYLEGLASADSVQKYVEQNAFGQQPITESNLSWTFYLKIIQGSPQLEDDSKNSSLDANGDRLSRCDHK